MQDMSNKRVSIIIVTCGSGGYLELCLNSIIGQTHKNFEIMVIDNSVNRDFALEISGHYPSIKLYSSPKNLFYCQALNIGIEISKGDFVLCLNDDVTLDERFIEEALKGFAINEKIGIVSGKILRSDRVTLDSTGLFLTVWRTAKERGYGIKDKGQFEREEYIFGVNGAVAFYRREMLEQIKINSEYFDTDFRIFYEDLDIAWRAHKFCWKGYYTPCAIAYHIRGGTIRQGRGIDKKYARQYLSDDLHYDLVKNRYLAIIKNEPFSSFLLHLPFIILYDIFVWGYILFFRPQLIKSIFSRQIPIVSTFRKRTLLKRRHLA